MQKKYVIHFDLIRAQKLQTPKAIKAVAFASSLEKRAFEISGANFARGIGTHPKNFRRLLGAVSQKVNPEGIFTNNVFRGFETHEKGNIFIDVPNYLLIKKHNFGLTGSSLCTLAYWRANKMDRWDGSLLTLQTNINIWLEKHGLEHLTYDQLRLALQRLKAAGLIKMTTSIFKKYIQHLGKERKIPSKNKLTGRFYSRVRITILDMDSSSKIENSPLPNHELKSVEWIKNQKNEELAEDVWNEFKNEYK